MSATILPFYNDRLVRCNHKEGEMAQRSADAMGNILLKDPGRLAAIQANPSEEVPKLVDEAKELAQVPNTTVYKIMVVALGVVAVFALIGAITLVAIGKTTPEGVVALGSASIGALAGALVPQKQQ
jgi:hypothetical protein